MLEKFCTMVCEQDVQSLHVTLLQADPLIVNCTKKYNNLQPLKQFLKNHHFRSVELDHWHK